MSIFKRKESGINNKQFELQTEPNHPVADDLTLVQSDNSAAFDLIDSTGSTQPSQPPSQPSNQSADQPSSRPTSLPKTKMQKTKMPKRYRHFELSRLQDGSIPAGLMLNPNDNLGGYLNLERDPSSPIFNLMGADGKRSHTKLSRRSVLYGHRHVRPKIEPPKRLVDSRRAEKKTTPPPPPPPQASSQKHRAPQPTPRPTPVVKSVRRKTAPETPPKTAPIRDDPFALYASDDRAQIEQLSLDPDRTAPEFTIIDSGSDGRVPSQFEIFTHEIVEDDPIQDEHRERPVRPTPRPSSRDAKGKPTVEPMGPVIEPSVQSVAQATGSRQESGLVGPFKGANSARKAASVRRLLDEALDQWWTRGELPSKALLRDGLLILKAGHELSESQLSMLLRASLFYRRGILTAIQHQTDTERIAFILKEALFDPSDPLPLPLLLDLQQGDEDSARWMTPLLKDLAEEQVFANGPRRQQAKSILQQLAAHANTASRSTTRSTRGATTRRGRQPQPRGRTTHPNNTASGGKQAGSANEKRAQRERAQRERVRGETGSFSEDASGIPWSKIILFLIVASGAVGLYLWQQQRPGLPEMITIPAGTYAVSDSTQAENVRLVELSAYAIDRTEVTNKAYRACYRVEACPWPQSVDSESRTNYFQDVAFDNYPVVFIDWAGASAYCEWANKRLPVEAEWEVAAGYAPYTERRSIFPWGNYFESGLANSAAMGADDTLTVGRFYPVGDSDFGLADMAGNVAEWTATIVAESDSTGVNEPSSDAQGEQQVETLTDSQIDQFVVKGGSYKDDEFALRVEARQLLPRNTAASWLGFRCSKTTLLTE